MSTFEKNLSRREFLQLSALVGAGLSLPFLFPDFVPAATDETLWKGVAGKAATDSRVLVVLELGGGNDGINTVVPFAQDAYYKARPNIGLAKDKVIRATDELGLNPGLKGLKGLLDNGNLAVINGVGYPNPNRSHFRSMEIWRTATDSDKYGRDGWVGRYFDETAPHKADPLYGCAVAAQFPLTFEGHRDLSVSFTEAGQFRYVEGAGGDTDRAFRAINRVDAIAPESSSDTGNNLAFLRHTTRNVVLSSDRVQRAAAKGAGRNGGYPNGRLGKDLKSVADLIRGGLPTRVYYVSHGGFDTHRDQLNQHERRLQEFGDAVAAFHKDLKASGLSDRVVILCFSEFGRRVEENASRGTDHGTAGPMFVIGDHITPGFHGAYPDLADLDSGDLKYKVDFRSVYATVLGGWMGSKPESVLGRDFQRLNILKA